MTSDQMHLLLMCPRRSFGWKASDSDPKATEYVLWACRFQALPANFFDNELASSAHATRPLDGIGVGNAESKAGDLSFYFQNFGTKDIEACPQCFCMFVLSGGKDIKKFLDRGFPPVAPVVA